MAITRAKMVRLGVAKALGTMRRMEKAGDCAGTREWAEVARKRATTMSLEDIRKVKVLALKSEAACSRRPGATFDGLASKRRTRK